MLHRKILLAASFLTCLTGGHALAQSKLTAFIVGIGDYAHLTTLPGPVDDARKIEEQLKGLGYRTVVAIEPKDTSRTSIALKWQRFLDQLQDGDDVVVYYSGHAVEVSGTNYLVPIDTPSAEEIGGEQALKTILISLQSMMSDLWQKNIRASVWVLDACRDNPFVTATKSLGAAKGLGQIQALGPIFIFYAANFGQSALASTSQSTPNSLYTWALADMIAKKPNVPVAELAVEVRKTVREIAKAQPKPHDQRPAYYDGLDEPWCFAGCSVDVAVLKGARYETMIKTVVATEENTIKEVVEEASKNVAPNAVYLGKEFGQGLRRRQAERPTSVRLPAGQRYRGRRGEEVYRRELEAAVRCKRSQGDTHCQRSAAGHLFLSRADPEARSIDQACRHIERALRQRRLLLGRSGRPAKGLPPA